MAPPSFSPICCQHRRDRRFPVCRVHGWMVHGPAGPGGRQPKRSRRECRARLLLYLQALGAISSPIMAGISYFAAVGPEVPRPGWSGLGLMLCAPIPHSLCSNSLLRTHDAINGMTLEQLRTGILQGCLFGRVAAPYVALVDFTMHHPFGHCPSWAAHEANAIFHDSSKRKKL